jgi:hypothetical protein
MIYSGHRFQYTPCPTLYPEVRQANRTNIVAYATNHPEASYLQIADTFGISRQTMSKYCVGLRRGD